MKKLIVFTLIIGLVLALSVGAVYAQRGNGGGGNGPGGCNNCNPPAQPPAGGNQNQYGQQNQYQYGSQNGYPGAVVVPAGDLSQTVIDAMNAGIQDEYNAYAAYQSVIDQFGAVIPFTRIQAAEAQHIAAWERQFTLYGLEVPEEALTVELPEFATLQDACVFAATAEQNNVSLYDDMLATFAGYPSLTRVVTQLRAVSLNNHLPAFERCAGL